jgi:hypothetical protein
MVCGKEVGGSGGRWTSGTASETMNVPMPHCSVPRHRVPVGVPAQAADVVAPTINRTKSRTSLAYQRQVLTAPRRWTRHLVDRA